MPLFIFSYIKNKDKEPFISAIEFYPPQNLNSADVAYAYNQKVSTRDMVSLIFYWASHNHIKIRLCFNLVLKIDIFIHLGYNRDILMFRRL